jgi:hypothetical protein
MSQISRLLIVSVFAALGAMACMSAPVLAAAPEKPEVTPATGVTSTVAALNGVVNPLAVPPDEVGTYQFLYKASTTGCEGVGKAPLSPGIYFGTGPEPFTEPVTGLAPGTEYEVCLRVEGTSTKEASVSSPPVPFTTVPTPVTDTPAPVAATTATLNGHFTLDATAATQSYFEYKAGTECTGGEVTATEEAGTGATVVSKAVAVSGLAPGQAYTVCLVTVNAFGSETGLPVTFKALAVPATIVPGSESVTEVTDETAKLGGEIDPGGAETTYYFEYGTGEAYGEKTPVTGLLASDDNPHSVSVPIQGLSPGTEYHYRLVVSNEVSGKLETSYGHENRTFTTESTGSTAGLPDGRQYELVSPAQKDGAQVFGLTGFGGDIFGGSSAEQASEGGEGITYMTSAPVGPEVAGNSQDTQVLSKRVTKEGKEEWASQDISPAHATATEVRINAGEPYRFFSTDLSEAVYEESESNAIAVRDNANGVPASEAFDSLPLTGLTGGIEFQDATPDLSHAIVIDGEGGATNIYEWSKERSEQEPVQVNILPGGASGSNDQLGGIVGFGEHPSGFAGRGALSNDGTRVVWGNESELFTRDMATEKTERVDEAQGGGGSGNGRFQIANSAGTKVFFADSEQLMSGAASGSLYMFESERAEQGGLEPLSNLTPVTSESEGGGVQEVLGGNEAGTVLYVVSSSVLATNANSHGDGATRGQSNIFMLRETTVGSGSWSTTFIATLSGSDGRAYFAGPSEPFYGTPPVRASSDGNFLAFMSAASLTGYDNRDANSGVPDEEVYEYHAPEVSGAGSGTLICASCNPTGARPAGEFDPGEAVFPGLPMDPDYAWEGRWLAGVIPGWNEALHSSLEAHKRYGLPNYGSRVLSDSGRLFFDSADALVPADVNGKEDVYEYEPGGVGSCSSSPPGCVALISGGQGSQDSDFVDASANGDDVFFITGDQLVPADKDNVFDMYDASVCGASEGGVATHSCFPSSSVASPPCTTADSCRAAQSPQPGVFATGGTATFSGAGNVTPAAAPVVKKTLTRAQRLAEALRACRKKPKGKKRGVCEARAKRSYGPVRKTKTKTKRRGK